MSPLRYRRHRFPPEHPARDLALLRFTLSYRDMEELLAERGFDLSYAHDIAVAPRLASPSATHSQLRQ